MESIGIVIRPAPMTDERNGIGARVRALRERAGWSQLELAKRSGVRQNTLSDIETGQTPSPQGFPPQIEEHPDRIRVWAQPATNRPRRTRDVGRDRAEGCDRGRAARAAGAPRVQ